MTVQVGDQYRNTSGTVLFGFFPPDAVCTVRAVDMGDNDAVGGDLVVEMEPPEGEHIARSAGVTVADLERDWEPVKAPRGKGK